MVKFREVFYFSDPKYIFLLIFCKFAWRQFFSSLQAGENDNPKKINHFMMKKLIMLLSLLIGMNIYASGQVTGAEENLLGRRNDTISGWNRGGVTSLNLAQTSLTNWSAGGQSSFSVNGLVNLFANYKRGSTAWDTSFDAGYGMQRQGEAADFIKTDDRFNLMSKYGKQAFGNFYYAALLNFRSQFTRGIDYTTTEQVTISNFLAPGYLLGAIGLDYKPNNYLTAFVAPITGQLTIVNDPELADRGAFGVEPGQHTLAEFGGYVRIGYSRNDFTPEILRNVSLITRIGLFSNYLNNPQNIDVDWETTIAMKVNRFLSVNLNTHLIYDDDIDIMVDGVAAPRVQFKEILTVGFSYNF
jgi:hypothetical protein